MQCFELACGPWLRTPGSSIPCRAIHLLLMQIATLEGQVNLRSRSRLDAVVQQRAPILQHAVTVDQALLLGRNALLVAEHALEAFNSVWLHDIHGNYVAKRSYHKDLDGLRAAEEQVDRCSILDGIISNAALVVEIGTGDYQVLEGRRHAIPLQNHGLHTRHRVRSIHVQFKDLGNAHLLHNDLHSAIPMDGGHGVAHPDLDP
mmetsp:Transcript_5847/g.18098  ORF Transcript_5847/g.18098 Transcript_5847/m.18098 type:complete len:203 (-) Transcript_5847:1-609(-)